MDKGRHKILIVDDDKFLLNMYRSKFQKYDQEVLALTSGEEALSKLRENYAPDIVLLDIVMPKPDGLELLEIIRKENLIPKAAIIILTNQGEAKEIEKAKSLNIAGYIVKAALIPSEVVIEVLKIAEDWKAR
jgi:CheY-like chemotaxis protein